MRCGTSSRARSCSSVAALDLERLLGRELEAAAALGIEHAPNTLGESTFGRQSQSIEPSRATSAAVRPSPITA